MTTIQQARPAAPERAAVTEADVLERAADLLEEFGLFVPPRRVRSRRHHPVCLAAEVALAPRDFDGDATVPTHKWLGLSDVPKWNDAPGRMKGEVVARLRDAAASLRDEARA